MPFLVDLGPRRLSGSGVVDDHVGLLSFLFDRHLSRFAAGMRKGTKVSQGDVIGYVGATGWATGPHLHYEFRVNNEARDPMTVNVVAQAPLTPLEMARFKNAAIDSISSEYLSERSTRWL